MGYLEHTEKAGSRYLRAFRHTGYESVLEGQVTKTGVGFVMKHKLNSIDDLFRKSMNKTVTQPRDTIKSDTVNTSQ